MNRLLGEYISGGAQGTVYHASEYYNRELVRLTDEVYGYRFVVKTINYVPMGTNVRQDDPLIDTLHILRMYEKVNTLPHVLPLVHWIVFFDKDDSIDSFSSKIDDIGNRVPRKLTMAFPLLEGTISTQIRYMNAEQRKDVCLQMINIVQSLHAIGIAHEDLHLYNLMYLKLKTGYYYVFVIDLDTAESPGTKDLDYLTVCDNIARIMYEKNFGRCWELESKEELYGILDTLMHRIDPKVQLEAFNKLGEVFKNTSFSDLELRLTH